MELDDLKNIVPKLSDIKKENNFSVPDGYFETFRNRLDEKIQEEDKKSIFSVFFQIIRPQLALASLMLTVVVIGYLGVKLFIPENSSFQNQYDFADLLEDEIYYMDEAFILESLMDYSGETRENSNEVSDELMDEIINYLADDEMSLELMLEDL